MESAEESSDTDVWWDWISGQDLDVIFFLISRFILFTRILLQSPKLSWNDPEEDVYPETDVINKVDEQTYFERIVVVLLRVFFPIVEFFSHSNHSYNNDNSHDIEITEGNIIIGKGHVA